MFCCQEAGGCQHFKQLSEALPRGLGSWVGNLALPCTAPPSAMATGQLPLWIMNVPLQTYNLGQHVKKRGGKFHPDTDALPIMSSSKSSFSTARPMPTLTFRSSICIYIFGRSFPLLEGQL